MKLKTPFKKKKSQCFLTIKCVSNLLVNSPLPLLWKRGVLIFFFLSPLTKQHFIVLWLKMIFSTLDVYCSIGCFICRGPQKIDIILEAIVLKTTPSLAQ